MIWWRRQVLTPSRDPIKSSRLFLKININSLLSRARVFMERIEQYIQILEDYVQGASQLLTISQIKNSSSFTKIRRYVIFL